MKGCDVAGGMSGDGNKSYSPLPKFFRLKRRRLYHRRDELRLQKKAHSSTSGMKRKREKRKTTAPSSCFPCRIWRGSTSTLTTRICCTASRSPSRISLVAKERPPSHLPRRLRRAWTGLHSSHVETHRCFLAELPCTRKSLTWKSQGSPLLLRSQP